MKEAAASCARSSVRRYITTSRQYLPQFAPNSRSASNRVMTCCRLVASWSRQNVRMSSCVAGRPSKSRKARRRKVSSSQIGAFWPGFVPESSDSSRSIRCAVSRDGGAAHPGTLAMIDRPSPNNQETKRTRQNRFTIVFLVRRQVLAGAFPNAPFNPDAVVRFRHTIRCPQSFGSTASPAASVPLSYRKQMSGMALTTGVFGLGHRLQHGNLVVRECNLQLRFHNRRRRSPPSDFHFTRQNRQIQAEFTAHSGTSSPGHGLCTCENIPCSMSYCGGKSGG